MSPLEARRLACCGDAPAAVQLAVRWRWSAIAAAEAGAAPPPQVPPGPHDLLTIELRACLSPAGDAEAMVLDRRSRTVAGRVHLRVDAPPHLAAMAFDGGTFAARGLACRTARHLHLDLDGEAGPLLRLTIPCGGVHAAASSIAAGGTYIRSPLPARLGVRGGTSSVGMLEAGGAGRGEDPARLVAMLLDVDQDALPVAAVVASTG